MKTLGIVGGIGPESTIVYYRAILAEYRALKPDGSAPSIIINSIDLHRMLGLIAAGRYAEVSDFLLAEVRRLAAAGATFALLAAGTPHIVFDQIQRGSPIPLLSLVEATRDAAHARGYKKVGLFGTRFTMQAGFFPEVFAKSGIAVVSPAEEEQTYIHDRYMNELVKGIVLPETRDRLLTIAEHMMQRDGIEGLILGGTELSLILGGTTEVSIPLLDATHIHVKRAAEALLA